MKTLQNNYTTPEQSKRLLELGVPADSADCYLNGDSVIMLKGKTFQENYNEDLDLARLHLIEYPHYIPCWSVGRLIEIYHICVGPGCSFTFHVCFPNLMNEIMYKLGEANSNGWLNLKKLEE